MTELTRRMVVGGAGMVIAGSAIASTESGIAPAKTVLVEQTYLKALPGLRADLTHYIVTNWFAMDQKGFDQGIFTHYALYEDIEENKDWDLVMAVSYPQDKGYDDPHAMATFKAIRAAHEEVLIGGKTLKELGSIVRHHKLKIVGV